MYNFDKNNQYKEIGSILNRLDNINVVYKVLCIYVKEDEISWHNKEKIENSEVKIVEYFFDILEISIY